MLAELPMVFILLGLAAYTVLAGADFGAGFWTLFPGGGRTGRAATRDHARHAMGPVWEANHVWLIFVLVVCWTAYPVAFASITSTLAVPLFVAVVGIILRGTSYALRGQLEGARGQRAVENVFALSSVLTPFALGAVAGGIASGRVPVGNAAGDLVTSWLNPTSVMIGTLAVATSAYLAAVYLAADARRLGERGLERDFRLRALWSGLVAGALALAGLLVTRADARPIWDGLSSGAGLVAVAVSAAAGLATLVLVWRSRFGPARASAALAVAAVVAGWALAQRPNVLPGLTVSQAAAGRSTLIAVTVAVAVGAVVLVPSLILLFGLFLRGRLDAGTAPGGPVLDLPSGTDMRSPRLVGAFALACLLVGTGLMVLSDSGWAHAVGIACLVAFAASAFLLATTTPWEEA
ncbi:MAG TPA: cytochrome d ubiquinol oxidase subunit II [Mycobacteriales bacterium]|nr:cytochrome d ubiquinol oxidase subunit II [Mycobacteriales bacterium]